MKDKEFSKFLSHLLRHRPDELNLNMDSFGWVEIKELVEKLNENSKYSVSMEYLEKIVIEDEKQRYAFNEDKSKIRAVQGHSIKVDLEFPEVVPPKYLYHGTGEKFLENILKTGIQRKTRQYVHLSSDIETAYKVGQRHGNPVILTISAYEMYLNGVKFYLSENGVYLTEYVDTKWISK